MKRDSPPSVVLPLKRERVLSKENLAFDPVTAKELTIADLKEIQEGKILKKESTYKENIEIEGSAPSNVVGPLSVEEKPSRPAKRELTQQEIDDLIFGRK